MDTGHYNCRDYHVALPFAADVSERPTLHRDESYEELMERSRSPASLQPRFPLLQLPLEIRRLILSYILPQTTELIRAESTRYVDHKHKNLSLPVPEQAPRSAVRVRQVNNVVWLRGNVTIMAVCSQLHQECAEMIYGTNTFLLFLTYNDIVFRCRYRTPHGFAPSQDYPFLELLPQRYICFIRRIIVHVNHVDSYTGMVKFNVGGRGLIHGLRKQRTHLSRVAIRVSTANEVIDNLNQQARRRRGTELPSREQQQKDQQAKDAQEILEPFSDLIGVSNTQVCGAVADDFADALEAQMQCHE